MFASLRHSVLNGLITVCYLLFTPTLLELQGVQICNLDHIRLLHLKQGLTLLRFIKKL